MTAWPPNFVPQIEPDRSHKVDRRHYRKSSGTLLMPRTPKTPAPGWLKKESK